MGALKHFTDKIAIEITGSISSAAQVKATSLELASNTKTTAQEVSQIKNIIKLIAGDLDQFRQIEGRETNIQFNNEETFGRAYDESMHKPQGAYPQVNENELSELKSKLKETQKNRDELNDQLLAIQS